MVPVEMLWQLSFLQCQCEAYSIMPRVEQQRQQHVTAISLQPRGQVSNVCSLRVSHSVLNRGRTCQSRVPAQTAAAIYGTSTGLKSLDSQGNLWYANGDNSNKSDTREVATLISVNQKYPSVAGEVAVTFLKDKQSVTPAFQANHFSVNHIVAGPLNWSDLLSASPLS